MRIQVATVRHVAESKGRGREGGRDSSLRQNNNIRGQWSLSEFRHREQAARRKWTANQPMGQEVVQQQLIINSV
jgi:hypothetical protein